MTKAPTPPPAGAVKPDPPPAPPERDHGARFIHQNDPPKSALPVRYPGVQPPEPWPEPEPATVAPLCMAVEPSVRLYRCTRELGHAGEHFVSNAAGEHVRWPQSGAAEGAAGSVAPDLDAALRSALAEGVGVEELLAGVERMCRERARESSSCTGVAASWCPVCGDCTCPVADDGVTRPNLDGEDCRLHGKDSDHCERADDAEVDHDPTASATDYGAELQRQRCKACWSACGFDYHVTDEAWAAVVPEPLRDRVLCLMCFDRFARAAGIDYRGALSPELYFAGDQVSLVLLDSGRLPGARDFVFTCPACGHPGARTVESEADAHADALHTCDQCGSRVLLRATLPGAEIAGLWTYCADALPAEAGRDYQVAALTLGGGQITTVALFNGGTEHWQQWVWPPAGIVTIYAWRPIDTRPPPLRPAERSYLIDRGVPPEWLAPKERK